ncbi:E3 ubiquitin-protein ligase SINAT2 [Capsicum chinense]|nr:E3 ubiquitin-protein ligase SINAT2 [Capsicum chinense]
MESAIYSVGKPPTQLRRRRGVTSSSLPPPRPSLHGDCPVPVYQSYVVCRLFHIGGVYPMLIQRVAVVGSVVNRFLFQAGIWKRSTNFQFDFCLHFEAFNLGLAPVYIAFIHFMGDDDDAIRFRYSLEVGGFGRKLTWQGVPRSIHDSHKAVRESLDGLIIHRSMALFFSGGDMN